jgi:hypothetical protein
MVQLSYYEVLIGDNVPTLQIRALLSRGAFSPTLPQRTVLRTNLQHPFPDLAAATEAIARAPRAHARGTNAPFEISGHRHCA